MDNERAENIFYLDLKHDHMYACAKFQPNLLFCWEQTGTESAAEEKKKNPTPPPPKKKKGGKPVGHLVQSHLYLSLSTVHKHFFPKYQPNQCFYLCVMTDGIFLQWFCSHKSMENERGENVFYLGLTDVHGSAQSVVFLTTNGHQ